MKIGSAAALVHPQNEDDVTIPDEPPPPGAGEGRDDLGPQWLKVLLFPRPQIWVTCQAEQQPPGAFWVEAASEPEPDDSGVRVVMEPKIQPRTPLRVVHSGLAATSSGPAPSPERGSNVPAPVIAVGPDAVGALVAGGATLLAGAGTNTLVDRIVLAGVEGLLRVLKTDAGLVRALQAVLRGRGAASEQVAMAPEQFAARHGFKRRAVYDFIREGLPTQGEGKRRRVPVAEGDAWMSEKATARIERRAKEAAAAHARQHIRAVEPGEGKAR